jgi:hypothetical protein
MKKDLRLVFTWLLFFCFPLLVNAQPKAPKALSPRTVPAVAISLANGKTFTVPADSSRAAHRMIAAIPLTGNDNVVGLRVEPYVSGNLVGVHVYALLGAGGSFANATSSCEAVRTWKARSIGSYLIGGTEESLQLADLTRFGLPALRVSVVRTTYAPATAEDGCCDCSGTICCPNPGKCFTDCDGCGMCCTTR